MAAKHMLRWNEVAASPLLTLRGPGHGYTYQGFCSKVAGAGCAGYVVSLLGRRVLYYGRTGETHTEYFPGT
jgi:uncharacterized protein YbcV (DUF1398 family)